MAHSLSVANGPCFNALDAGNRARPGGSGSLVKVQDAKSPTRYLHDSLAIRIALGLITRLPSCHRETAVLSIRPNIRPSPRLRLRGRMAGEFGPPIHPRRIRQHCLRVLPECAGRFVLWNGSAEGSPRSGPLRATTTRTLLHPGRHASSTGLILSGLGAGLPHHILISCTGLVLDLLAKAPSFRWLTIHAISTSDLQVMADAAN